MAQFKRNQGDRHGRGGEGGEKCRIARGNGYEEVIDYRSENFADRVMDLTDGRGVDVVYDSVGKDTIMGSLDCLKTFGTLVSFGQSSGFPDQLRISHLAKGSFYLTRPVLFHFAADRGWLERSSKLLFDLVIDGSIKIDKVSSLPLLEAGKAHENLEARKTIGSTVLIP